VFHDFIDTDCAVGLHCTAKVNSRYCCHIGQLISPIVSTIGLSNNHTVVLTLVLIVPDVPAYEGIARPS